MRRDELRHHRRRLDPLGAVRLLVAFGESGSSLWGGLDWAGMRGLTAVETTINGGEYGIPLLVFPAFQLMFAIITPALISAAWSASSAGISSTS